MSDIINILPDSVANQIAAGEVVDRPASAVKELLENAMDAGATEIQLIVKDAGRTLIQVIDNGCGMSDTDASLCFERHATSKIKQAADLFDIHTMGFRGEALASIAAIAQVELRTRLHDAELGTEIVIEGSTIQSQHPVQCPSGTSIAVKNLFFNVPARRNFLKKDAVELSHIEETLRRIALIHSDIAFTFYHNGRMLYDLRAGNMAQRIAQVFSPAYKERLYAIDESCDVVTIKGYIGKAEYARKTRGEQYLFVNGRFIKHPSLSTAIERAYADMLPERTYPSYFVGLTVDPSRIDINIHPTKTEVKFIDEQTIFAMLRATAKKALGQFVLASEFEFNPSTEIDFSPAPKGYIPAEPTISYNHTYNPFGSPSAQRREAASRWVDFFDQKATAASTAPSAGAAATPDPSPTLPLQQAEPEGMAQACMQVQERYIVSSVSSGIVLIDQQRAHERIIYDRLMARGAAAESPQQLLFPVNCSFSPADAEIVSDLMPDIKARGFDIAPLGQNTFVVTATPTALADCDLQQLLDRIVADYKNSMLQKFADRNQCLALSLARQMAVRPGKRLEQAEMQQMVADLFSSPMPDRAPDGRKTFVIIDPDSILQ
ncbi:MAG: DNA mismatch repair endonuclease MutL [Bacteroidales bacterium]|nr:DNA mismatch repair endonuclease MutL [Bacteroidales bacterium]